MAVTGYTIQVNVPVAISNSLEYRFGYQATIDGQPNPQPGYEFVGQKIIDMIANLAEDTDLSLARAAADLQVREGYATNPISITMTPIEG